MKTTFSLLGVFLSLSAAAFCHGASYRIVDLAPLPECSRPYGIDELGRVVGQADDRAVLWEPANGVRYLDVGGAGGSQAIAINSDGQVAGTSHLYDAHGCSAFVWSDGTGIVDLGTLYGGQSWGYDITDDGHVFGLSITWDRKLSVFEWSPEFGMRDLGLPDGVQEIASVNNAHEIVGSAWDAESSGHKSFLWSPSQGMRTIPLGPIHISDSGMVAGGLDGEAAIWEPVGGLRMLGIPSGGYSTLARGVNDLGQAVGEVAYYGEVGYVYHAFYWGASVGMVELPSLGGSYAGAWAIGNTGTIAGFSSTPDGMTHAVLWTPVPEPSTLSFLSLALAGIGVGRLRRRRAA